VVFEDPTYIKVYTYEGNGADNDLDEQAPANSGATATIMQYRHGNGRHRIPVMRFDVSGYDLSQVTDATLNVWLARQHTKPITLRGILPIATNAYASWDINTYVEAELNYTNMPGMGEWDNNTETDDWIEGQSVIIGTNTIYGLASDPFESVDGGGNLTAYLRGQAGQTNIVLVWQHANVDNNLGRIMTKEAAQVDNSVPLITGSVGDFAPFLRFKIGSTSTPIEITSHSRSGNQLTLAWTGGTGPFKVQKKTLITDAWADEQTGIAGNSANVTISLDGGGSGYYQVVGQ
jgi:hypothetical protein